VAASYTEVVVVQELISGAMAAADAAAAAAVAADSEAARRKERAKHKRQRKRHRDRGSHNQRTNKRKNLRRSEGRKARARTRAQMAPVLSQLSHLTRSRLAVEPRLSKQARPPSRMPSDADLYICATIMSSAHFDS
jgi:Ni/Co efflux regulator RcnB